MGCKPSPVCGSPECIRHLALLARIFAICISPAWSPAVAPCSRAHLLPCHMFQEAVGRSSGRSTKDIREAAQLAEELAEARQEVLGRGHTAHGHTAGIYGHIGARIHTGPVPACHTCPAAPCSSCAPIFPPVCRLSTLRLLWRTFRCATLLRGSPPNYGMATCYRPCCPYFVRCLLQVRPWRSHVMSCQVQPLARPTVQPSHGPVMVSPPMSLL